MSNLSIKSFTSLEDSASYFCRQAASIDDDVGQNPALRAICGAK